jgi:NADPH:quinone reductase-like Zn-dependent oxidoreductase
MSLPDQMLAIEILHGSLKSSMRKLPLLSENQVLIRVAAAGVNQSDVMQRKGLYPPPNGASDIPGLEVAGTVVALDDNVGHLKIGDKICALVTGGAYADIALPQRRYACLYLKTCHLFRPPHCLKHFLPCGAMFLSAHIYNLEKPY